MRQGWLWGDSYEDWEWGHGVLHTRLSALARDGNFP